MFDNESLGPEILGNPAMLQYRIMQDLQSRILDGTIVVASTNNGFNALLDASASITAQFVKQEDKKFEALYPKRAQAAKDIYAFLSDYDYVNITATPASIQFQLILDKNWIVENAVSYDDNFNKMLIPATSTIVLGSRTFGLYYPIEFLVNKTNSVVTVDYDITTTNPLKTFSTNMLPSVSDYTMDGVEYLRIVFDAWQYTATSYDSVVATSTGFTKTFTYTDQFYAARVYTYINSVWTEISYSLSQMVYDISTATAILTPMSDTSTLRVDIPQIYFTQGMIGSKVRVVVYTSEGAINATIPQTDAEGMQYDFDTNSSAYATPFYSAPTLVMAPYNTTSIVGGADPLALSTIREQLINGSLYGEVPIWESQLEDAVSKYGYSMYKYLDNITDRIYFAGSAMEFSSGGQVPCVVSNIILEPSDIAGDPDTIISYSNNTITILPTTIFEFNQSTNTSTPLSNDGVARLGAMTSEDLVTELNNKIYTRQPFHIVLDTSAKYPAARSYNLMDPAYTTLTFIRENPNSAARLTISDSTVTHQNNGTGGFLIKFGVQITEALQGVDKSKQSIFLLTTNKSGVTVYLQASYINSTSTLDVYSAVLPLNYMISTDGYFRTTLPDATGTMTDCDLPLTCTFTAMMCVDAATFPTIAQDATLYGLTPASITEDWLVTAEQQITYQFGEDLSSMVYNIVNTTWGASVYATYPTDVYYTYGKDQYLCDASGMLVTRVVTASDGTKSLQMVKTHSAADYTLTGSEIKLTIKTTQATPTATITTSDITGVLVGAKASGSGIAVGTTVTAIDPINNTVTLSAIPSAVTSGSILYIQNGDTITTVNGAQSVVGNTLTLTDVTNVIPGMTICGFDIPSGTTIESVSGFVATLSASTTAAVSDGAVVEIFNSTGPFLKQHAAGDVMYDALGKAVETQSAQNVYGIQAIQFDARLYASEDTTDEAYVDALTSTLVTNAHALDTVRNDLLERTYLYYKPYRTLGTANFGIGDGEEASLPLDMSFSVVFYVTSAVKNNATLCADIESNTITVISDYIQDNTTISSYAIGELLTTQFSSNIVSLDVSGIYRNDEYLTLALLDTDVAPSVSRILAQDSDGSLYMTPDVTVTFKLDPSDMTSTSSSSSTA